VISTLYSSMWIDRHILEIDHQVDQSPGIGDQSPTIGDQSPSGSISSFVDRSPSFKLVIYKVVF
jgi:hypothetical protein